MTADVTPVQTGRDPGGDRTNGSGAAWLVDPRQVAVPISRRTAVLLIAVSVIGLAMFCWPLLWQPAAANNDHVLDAPLMFVAVLPVLVLVVLSSFADGALDTRSLAVLGVLSAVNAALRPLGAGNAGLETVFFMLILAGRVFGPGFGFVLGCTSMFASALITGGVGPWLPFQMVCSAWIGLGAGLLPNRPRGKAELAMLIGYGIVVAYLFGALMNLWFWPFALGTDVPEHGTSLAFVPGDPVAANLRRFGVFTFLTSTASYDTVRAITNTLGLVIFGPGVLVVLRRTARRAQFVR